MRSSNLKTSLLHTQPPEQAAFRTCCKTLHAYCRNVYCNLGDDSKRAIKLENKALRERVLAVDGGLAFLQQVGFEVRLWEQQPRLYSHRSSI